MAGAWVSVEEVAKHVGGAKDSVYRWIEKKRLRVHRMGRLWKFWISEVDTWVLAGGPGDGASSDGKKRER